MQFTTPGETWIDWLAANEDRDDATKLGALREIIAATARTWTTSGEITADWANKKLAKLGITERLDATQEYELEVPVNVPPVRMRIRAANRTDALSKLNGRLGGYVSFRDAEAATDPTFLSGPEDAALAAVDPDAPQTVDATLMALREIILLGNVSGPRFDCDSGGSAVLASFGLAPIPARKQFVVTRPVTGTARTVVTAYDEDSALTIAGWRWDNNRSGHELAEATETGDPAVDVN